MDTLSSLLAHLGLDPFQHGLQLLDPLKAAPDPTLPLLAGPLTAANLAGAQKVLLRHYPSDHGAILATLRSGKWTTASVKLGSLALPRSYLRKSALRCSARGEQACPEPLGFAQDKLRERSNHTSGAQVPLMSFNPAQGKLSSG